jgi:hypothetical protein
VILVNVMVAGAQMARTSHPLFFGGASVKGGGGMETFSFASSQGVLPDSLQFYVAVHNERKFMVKGLEAHQAVLALPLAGGYVGISGFYAGNSDHSEVGMSLAYGMKLSNRLAAGVQFNRFVLRTKGYAGLSSVNMEGGICLQVTPQLAFGLHIYNPTGSTWNGDSQSPLPRIYGVLLDYTASDKFFIQTGFRKIEDAAVGVAACIGYVFAPAMMARAGIESSTGTVYLGSGIRLRSLWMHLTSALHPQLGFTPGLMISYGGSKK